jgi:prevent-host-death family protein
MMKIAAVSELKAQLAKFLRLVKSGEEVEIRERGIPVAILKPANSSAEMLSIPPRKDPSRLARMKFRVKPDKKFDVVELLVEERKKR